MRELMRPAKTSNRYRYGKALLGLVALLLLVAGSVAGEVDDAPDDNDKAQRLRVLDNEIQRLQHGQNADHIRQQALQDRLHDLDILATKLDKKRVLLLQDSTQQQQQIIAYKRQQKALQKEQKTRRKRILKHLTSLQRQGIAEPMVALFSIEDLHFLERFWHYQKILYSHRKQQLLAYKQTEQSLQILRQKADQRAQALAVQSKLLMQQADEIRQTRQQRQKLHSELEQQRVHRGELLERRLQQQKSLQELINGQDATPFVLSSAPFSRRKGRLSWPLQGHIWKRYQHPMGQGDLRYTGIVIAAPLRTLPRVRAVAAGKVLFSGSFRGFQNIVILDHAQGYISLYGYNRSLLVETGQTVVDGQAIAVAGSMNENAQVQLYFEIRLAGEALNPLPWLRSPRQ